ncbi:SusC/RagA family TonB-linked outer membrane protein [Labilibaculum euxinus]|uniref:SusC/RagA family TonB-linked outer membrane protein n=1 Tax=Labilibaculum euxinus TaxID=2686357 RepID=A0A7M4D968_9BACT|nr:TonB-dependent receptor [Labilibaculum euxinus]MUP39197.1 SusC/RagA family TonB-linked outer membrane protein [Labilibaculum euxinus]MVB08402.1 SusC/RagA family TonB-linked outer membrane protein [Labilibaculum euxinus]
MKKNYLLNVFKLKKFFSVKKMILLLLVLVINSAFAGSQQALVTGKITDLNSGAPLPGVNIIIKGTTKGVSSNFDGTYSIDVSSPKDVLVFSFLGYKAQEISVGNNKNINIKLAESTQQLDEMVVIGYGAMKKRNLTGSITSISSKSLENTPIKDVMSALQGRASGVQVVSNSGAPGDGITVTVRGQSSLNSGNDPLYVIDGVAVETTSLSLLNGWDTHGLNPLADINPNDIESIEVLKDGASTSIYGSRAANGVILITTKRGHEGKANIKVNVFTGLSKITRKLSVLNASQWREIIMDTYKNLDDYNNKTTYADAHWTAIDSLNPMNSGDVDWQDVMYRTAKQKQIELSVTGGTKNAKYALSTSALDQDGIFLASNFKRITSRLNADFTVSDKLKIGYNLSYAHAVNNRINAGGTGNNSLVQSILVRPPVYSLTYPNGDPINYFNGKRNPVGLAKEATHLNTTNRVIGNQYLEYEIIKNLKFKTTLSLDFISMKEDQFYPTTVDYRAGYNSGAVRATSNQTWANENYLTYVKSFNDEHNFSALVGYSQQEWKLETTGLDGMYFASDNIRTLNGAGTISNQAVNTTVEHSLASYFGRLSYDYKSKYLFQANLRADGSSRFGKNNRFGYFPSASAAWRFSDESFIKNLSFLNDGKLRFSAGQTGNEAIGNYTSQGEFALSTNYLDNSGASPTVMPNSGLTWETTTQYDAGIDLTLLKNRIIFTGDAYLKKTSDLLFAVPIPETTGFGYITQNIGEVQNKGLELSLTTYNFTGKFKWNSSFNISFNRNKILSLPEEVLTNGYIQNGTYHILKEGESIGTFYGWNYLGVYSRDEDNVNHVRMGSSNGKEFRGGDPIWDDLNGDNIIDDNDKQIIGNAQPKFTGGFNNDFSYKNFSLNVFFQFTYGNDIYSNLNMMRNWVFAYNNVSTDALNRWKEQGDVTDYPRPIRLDPLKNEYQRVSNRWIEDGSFLRLKNITLAYNVPEQILNKLKISGLKFYVTGQNLVTWTHYTGYDPEVSSYSGLRLGVDDGSYPQSRTYIFGLNVQF